MPSRRVSFVTLNKRKQENPRQLLKFGGMDDTKTSKCPVSSPVPTPAPTKSNIQAMEELLQMAKITKAQQPKKWGKFVQEEKMRSYSNPYSRPTATRNSQPVLQNMERLAKIRGGKKIHQIQKLRELAQLTEKPKREKSKTYKRLKALDTPLALPKPISTYSRPTASKITPSKTMSEKMAKVRAARKTTRVAKVKGAKKIKQIQTLQELAQLPKKQKTYKRLKNLDAPEIIVSKPKSKSTPKPSYSRPTATRVAPSKAMAEKMAKVRAARKINKMNQMQRLRGLAKLTPKSQPSPKPTKSKSKPRYKRLKNLDQANKKKKKKSKNLVNLLRRSYTSTIPKSQRGRTTALHPSTKLKYNNLFLEKLYKTKNKKQRRALIDQATPAQIDTVSEIILNLLRGHISLKNKHKKRLGKFKDQLRALASKNISLNHKKKLLNQHGGSMAAAAVAEAALSNVQQYNAEYSNFCTKEKLAAGEDCEYAPKDYSSWEYSKEHNDNVKCCIL